MLGSSYILSYMETKEIREVAVNDGRRFELNQWSVDSWGTAYLLDRRIKRLAFYIGAVGFIGFIIPILIGLVFLNVDSASELFSKVKPWIGWALIAQGVLSAVIVFFGMQGKLKVYQDSASINKSLSDECRDLAINMRASESYLQQRFDELKGRIRAQNSHDERLGFSPKDRRRGGRSGLKKFGLSCRDCKKIPSSESAKKDSSTCPSCGDF